MSKTSPARRVDSVEEITQPGDYYYNPEGSSADNGSLWFCLPIDDPNNPKRSTYLHRISTPPWTFRECADRSIEVRASILTYEADNKTERWHGYLDEGNVWREL